MSIVDYVQESLEKRKINKPNDFETVLKELEDSGYQLTNVGYLKNCYSMGDKVMLRELDRLQNKLVKLQQLYKRQHSYQEIHEILFK